MAERFGKIFASVGSVSRQAAFDQAKAALGLAPDPTNGRAVFLRHCAGCHRLNREGIAVGPDLFDIRHQPKETILLHVVIPEAEIAPNFVNYVCETTDGRSLTGLLAAETPASVRLRQAQGIEETVAREQIVSLRSTPQSMMPEELERAMSLQEMADLLGYLRGENSRN